MSELGKNKKTINKQPLWWGDAWGLYNNDDRNGKVTSSSMECRGTDRNKRNQESVILLVEPGLYRLSSKKKKGKKFKIFIVLINIIGR